MIIKYKTICRNTLLLCQHWNYDNTRLNTQTQIQTIWQNSYQIRNVNELISHYGRYVGMSMLIFGFLVMFGSMIYCVFVCRDIDRLRTPHGQLYWTNHWTKSVKTPEIHYTNKQTKPSDGGYAGSEYSYNTNRSQPTIVSVPNGKPKNRY